MFKILKEKLVKKEKQGIIIGAPIEGEAVSIKEVKDPTFSKEILGKGIAIKPSKGKVVAPVDSEVIIIFETKHAVTLRSQEGAEILIHIGLDTVQLKGQHFITYVKAGDKVKAGELLIEFDIDKIKEAGYDTICPMVLCNTTDFLKVKVISKGEVKELEPVLEIIQ